MRVLVALIVSAFCFTAIEAQAQSPLRQMCKTRVALPKHLIYKTTGSDHFTDCRRHTAGLIMKFGRIFSGFPSKLQVVARNGAVVGSMARYALGGGYLARYYSCIGGTPAMSGAALAARARAVSGSTRVYLKLNSTCFGPIEAGRCYNSSNC